MFKLLGEYENGGPSIAYIEENACLENSENFKRCPHHACTIVSFRSVICVSSGISIFKTYYFVSRSRLNTDYETYDNESYRRS